MRSWCSGFGVYKWPDGREYTGFWENSRQNGRAVFKWPDGRIYVGQYKDGKINGFGILDWPDGRRYDGHWVKGMQDGEGNYWSTSGEYRRGKAFLVFFTLSMLCVTHFRSFVVCISAALFTAGVRVKWLGEPVTAEKEPLKLDFD